MNRTSIEWTNSTWSPLRVRVRENAAQIARDNGYSSLIQIAERMAGHVGSHCEHVSPGCQNCYASNNNHRCLPNNGTGLPYDRRSRDLVESFVDEKILLQPLRSKSPKRIFVENQSDLFGEWYSDEQIDRIFAVMALNPQHTFQLLTKRPERMREYISYLTSFDVMRSGRIGDEAMRLSNSPCASSYADEWPLSNVWLGVSVENQQTADERIPLLLQTPAAVRFISAEPLLGPVDLRKIYDPEPDMLYGVRWWRTCLESGDIWQSDEDGFEASSDGPFRNRIDWVIVGGESGHNARPMHPDWARSLRDQCHAAGVPFFMKQMGSSFGKNKGKDLPDDLNIRQFPEVQP